jgi:hypothetical protein
MRNSKIDIESLSDADLDNLLKKALKTNLKNNLQSSQRLK